MKVFSITNEKGGTAKSITAVNLSYNLSTQGYRVLLIDNDKQGNTSAFYGYEDSEKGTHNLLSDDRVNIKDLIKNTSYENLDVIPTNLRLLLAVNNVMVKIKKDITQRFKKAFEQIKDEYDYIIIDNSPTLDINVINSICAAHEIIVPIKVDNFATQGLDTLLSQIHNIKVQENTNIEKVNLLFTMYNNSKVYKKGMAELKEIADNNQYGLECNVFENVIRRTVVVDDSTYKKMPLQLMRKNNAKTDYMALAEEILLKK